MFDLERGIADLFEVVKGAEVSGGRDVFELARAYLSDARHFLEKGRREDALEAYAIAWAYIDALLHLGLIRVPDRFLSLFTVDVDE